MNNEEKQEKQKKLYEYTITNELAKEKLETKDLIALRHAYLKYLGGAEENLVDVQTRKLLIYSKMKPQYKLFINSLIEEGIEQRKVQGKESTNYNVFAEVRQLLIDSNKVLSSGIINEGLVRQNVQKIQLKILTF